MATSRTWRRDQPFARLGGVTEYGVCGKRGDFDPLISEDLFSRMQGDRDLLTDETRRGAEQTISTAKYESPAGEEAGDAAKRAVHARHSRDSRAPQPLG